MDIFKGNPQPGDIIRYNERRCYLYLRKQASTHLSNVWHHVGLDLETMQEDFIFSTSFDETPHPSYDYTIISEGVEYRFPEDPGYP
jgi:ureidoglycolate hydrolase